MSHQPPANPSLEDALAILASFRKRPAKRHAHSQQPGIPLCQRHIARRDSEPRKHPVSNFSGMSIANEQEAVNCRHCLRELGAIPPLRAQSFAWEEELDDDMEEEEIG